MPELNITFVKGARRVTGSNFLVEAKEGGKTTRILIDCGLTQGERFSESGNNEKFPYGLASIDAIFFTHAHADHIGLFPKLVREGFNGRAFATPPTKALMPIMLLDTSRLMADEANRRGENPPYRIEDIPSAVSLVEELGYRSEVTLSPDVSVTLYNAGHIIGSALVLVKAFGTKILFTGDLGRVPAILVPDREIPKGVDYLVTESVYGNRVHGTIEESEAVLLKTVTDIEKKKGVLLIPAFSLERTQIILSALERAITEKKISPLPVFMDSPLAAKVTEVYRHYPEFLRQDIRTRVEGGNDPFSFKNLSVTLTPEESYTIDRIPPPKIIIAGAGMSHGGRIRKHELRYLPEKTTTLLLSGYQAAGSLGRRLKDGARKVEIDGQWVTVRAKILSLVGFSAHADRDDLLDFVEKINPKKVFVVLGETEAATFLAQRISGFLNVPVEVPREGERVNLEL